MRKATFGGWLAAVFFPERCAACGEVVPVGQGFCDRCRESLPRILPPVCPLCGREMKRFRSFYGCTGYREGCKFSVNTTICRRVIPVVQLKKLITEGKTDLLSGFVSARTGKTFEAALRLSDGKAVFDFPPRAAAPAPASAIPPAVGEEPPLPEPPPGY